MFQPLRAGRSAEGWAEPGQLAVRRRPWGAELSGGVAGSPAAGGTQTWTRNRARRGRASGALPWGSALQAVRLSPVRRSSDASGGRVCRIARMRVKPFHEGRGTVTSGFCAQDRTAGLLCEGEARRLW